jgi:hypothetical protein
MNGNNDGDGHVEVDADGQPLIKGPLIDLNKLTREDGLLTKMGPQHQSLLHRVISAEKENANYRQELKVANYGTTDEADDAVSALDECRTLGMDPTPIIDQIMARSSGKNHDLLYEALRTLTHTSFTTNYQKQKNEQRNRKSSPFP